MLENRSLEPEIMDQPDQPPEITRKFHRDLKLIHRLMGNWQTIVSLLKNGGTPRSIIDIGCGDGALLAYLRRELHLKEVIGLDLKPPTCAVAGVPVISADATRDPVPRADAAVCVMVLHHLTDDQVIALIRNVSHSVNRFICVDPVRHWLAMVLWTVLLVPLLSKVGAADGAQSIRRSFQPAELRNLAERALEGRPARISVTHTPLWTKLVLDIAFEN
jgi:2-polyprenyl-3-methyl-5-hydroxy-6-metoxy-1,4-benzoquinol methylase